ncbi:TolC family protein [Caballeronia sp.]|uniref:TolC family protein n=1 Tax=Caballeronia sp. TaxID=1931223 RepID=UPI003C3704A4
MTQTYFKPKTLVAALILGGACASASAAESSNLEHMVERMLSNASMATPTTNPLQLGQYYRAPAPARDPKKVDVQGALDGALITPQAQAPQSNADAARDTDASTQSVSGTMDMSNSLDAATENALTTKIARGQADQAQARVMGARAAYYPKINVIAKTPDKIVGAAQGYGRSYDQSAQASATLQYTMFDFGRRKNQVQSASLAAQASESAYQSEVETLTLDTSRAYLEVVRLQHLRKISDDYVAQVRRLNQVIEQRVAGGLSAQSDAIRGQLALTSAQARSRQIKLQLAKAEQQFRSITGKDALPQPRDSVKRLPPVNVEPLVDADADTNLAVKARRLDVASNNALVNVERASRYPRIDLVGTYRKPLQAVPSPGSSVMMQVSFDLFDGGLRKSRINEAVAAKYVAQQKLEQELRNVNDQKQSLRSDWNSARDQWALSIEGEKQALRTLDLYADEFRLGTRPLSDLISAQVDLFTARSDREQAESSYNLSTLALYNLDARTMDGLRALGLVKGEM